MSNRKIQVAALCALLTLAKLQAQTGITDPKLRAQWEKEQKQLQQNSNSGNQSFSTASKQKKASESEIQLAERLGLLRTGNGSFAIKWHNSDLILALPESNNNPNQPSTPLGIIQDRQTRQNYAEYSFLMPNGKAIAAIRTEIIPADTTNGVPEFWLFRALNLTDAEIKMGSTALEAIGALPNAWPTSIESTIVRPSAKEQKILDVARKINASADSTLTRNVFWTKAALELASSKSTPLQLTYGNVGICVEKNFTHYSTLALSARTAPLASQLYLATLPYLSRLEANPTGEERILLLKDLKQLGEVFFKNYNSNADAAYFANIVLLIESEKPGTWLGENAAYTTYRDQQKATYPFAQAVLQNSIFTDVTRYRQWLAQSNEDLLKTVHTDPVTAWSTRPAIEFKTVPYTATEELSNKEATQLYYVPTKLKSTSLHSHRTNLTELLNSRAKQIKKEEKKEKLPISKRYPLTPVSNTSSGRGSRTK